MRHAFAYRFFAVYLDLAELESVFRGRRLWSTARRTVAEFRRSDHHGDPDLPLDESIRRLVAEKTGRRPEGPIRLLTQLRYFGYVFNPVSFYYCFEPSARRVETIVAEINNTPWGEQHCYVLADEHPPSAVGHKRFHLRKEFHISPYMDMGLAYDWRFTEPTDRLAVAMKSFERGQKLFDATMKLRRREISTAALTRVLLRYPLMTTRIIAAIYWQALRLRLKGAPFFAHPRYRNLNSEQSPA